MQIRQLSVNYLPEQDRILLRVNTATSEEMRLWLTRRLMAGLWPLLNRLTNQQLLQREAAGSSLDPADDDLKKMLTDYRKDQLLREADFQTPYEDKPAAFPLGSEPLLVTDVDVTPQSDGGLRLHFHERRQAQEQRNFRIQMEPRLVQGLMHLVEQSLQRAQWAEPFGTSLGEDDASLGDAPASGKPRYLN
jgi:hypothetical protein